MPREHFVTCRLSRHEGHSAADHLTLEIDGRPVELKLKIAQLAQKMLHNLPPVLIDLIEVAACVYAADSAISRGGPTELGMGKLWRRNLRFEIPVRVPDLWNTPEVSETLAETLGFLSEDSYAFSFTQNDAPQPFAGYLDFGTEEGFAAEEVVLFSGGLDSLAGALEEVISHGVPVVLVSHHSANKIARVQSDLIAALKTKTSESRILHVPVTAHLRHRANREGTHRTRSFLFAALGVAVGRIFGRDRLRFYENGVVSINLPPVGQVIGARASRTTHPAVLNGFGRFFSELFGRPVRVENPYIWKTKRDVLDVIAQHDAADLIAQAHSCADVHHRNKMHPHCGRCSQCIDRRLAVLAAGLGAYDHAESYAVDLFRGPRTDVRDREMALAYVRHARQLRAMSDRDFLTKFGEVNRSITAFDEPAGAVARRIFELHRRHGETVAGVVEQELQKLDARDIAALDPDCLLRLAGADLFTGAQSGDLPPVAVGAVSLHAQTIQAGEKAEANDDETYELTVRSGRYQVEITGLGKCSGMTAEVLATLAEHHLMAAGEGRVLADYPIIRATALAKQWNVGGEEAVRKRINRARGVFKRKAAEKGVPAPARDAIIENLPWKGYRLNPWRVQVIRQ